MKYYFLSLILIFTSLNTFAFTKEDLIRIWVETKYQNCPEQFIDELTTKSPMSIRSALEKLAASPACQGNARRKCFEQMDGSLVVQSDFNKRAETAGCQVRAEYRKAPAKKGKDLMGHTTSCTQQGAMNRQTGSKICKARVNCSYDFQINGKEFEDGKYLFHCDQGEGGQCPEFYTQCSVKTVEVEGTTVFGKEFGGSKTEINGSQ